MTLANIELHTIRYLATLLNCSLDEAWERPLTWQTVDDNKARQDPRLVSLVHGSIASLAQKLLDLNGAGAGILVSPHRTDLRGRAKNHIVGLRGWHSDIDFERQTLPVNWSRLPLIPTMIVGTGRGVHPYWLVSGDELPCAGDEVRQATHEAELRSIQSALAGFGADPAACDISRVLRVPGFFNCKREKPALATLDLVTHHRYDQAAIVQAFPSVTPVRVNSVISSVSYQVPSAMTVRRARGYLAKIDLAVHGANGHTQAFVTAMKLFSMFGLDTQTVFDLMAEHYNPHCTPPFNEAELMRKVKEASKRAQARPLDPKPFPISRSR